MTKIYYFSGTGNSLWSAKKIASGLGGDCELFNIPAEMQKNEIKIEADAVILVFPSYAYGLPLIIRRFAKKAVINTQYLAAFVTFGSSPRGTMGSLQRILKKKNIAKRYFGKIPAVENFLAIFGPPDEEKIKNRTSMQEKATEEAIQIITDRMENRVSGFNPFSAYVSWLFSLGTKMFYKSYGLSKTCNGCGICEKICPVASIKMKEGKPVFTANCELCQACVNICPLRAIKFGKVKFGTAGYKHPSVSIEELERKGFFSNGRE